MAVLDNSAALRLLSCINGRADQTALVFLSAITTAATCRQGGSPGSSQRQAAKGSTPPNSMFENPAPVALHGFLPSDNRKTELHRATSSHGLNLGSPILDVNFVFVNS
jgi:hypothetical protein